MNQGFYKSLRRLDEGDRNEDGDEEDNDDSDSEDFICYNEVDSSKTIYEAIADITKQTPANHLANIYADKEDRLSDGSDSEDKGVRINLDKYTGYEFSTCDVTGRWMEWDSK